jgi:hypothetical protein
MRGTGAGYACIQKLSNKVKKIRCVEWNVPRLNTPALIFMKIRAKVLRDWYVVQMDEGSQPIC